VLDCGTQVRLVSKGVSISSTATRCVGNPFDCSIFRKKGRTGDFRGDLRIDVEKQPAARAAEQLEVPNVQSPALAVEADPLLASRCLAEQLQRLDAPSARGMDLRRIRPS